MDYKILLIIAITIIILDAIWLNTFGKYMYVPMINDIQHTESKIKIVPVIITYILMILLVYYYCLPLIKNKTYSPFFCGFFIGILIYGIFDMTNLALFNKYTYKNAILDMMWGGLLLGSTCYVVNNTMITIT